MIISDLSQSSYFPHYFLLYYTFHGIETVFKYIQKLIRAALNILVKQRIVVDVLK